MGTSARIIEDSINPVGNRITTFILRYPRYIHSELMTHRVFSKNSSSSRAIPLSKMLNQIINDPVVPVHFGKNQSGMSANEELTGFRKFLARQLWLKARWPAIFVVYLMKWVGLHKQIANRILEPWMYIEVVLTGTEFENFYSLRCDKAHAHPDIYLLAELMLHAHNHSNPWRRKWHTPFVTEEERITYIVDKHDENTLMKISAARCCRVSYLNLDNTKPNIEKDLKLCDQLLQNHHMSPFEHQATALEVSQTPVGNFVGWFQYRKTLNNECINSFERLLKK